MTVTVREVKKNVRRVNNVGFDSRTLVYVDYLIIEYFVFRTWPPSLKVHFKLSIHIFIMSVRQIFTEIQVVYLREES